MIIVTEEELQKRFEECLDMALTEPVSITDREQESVVILSMEEYERLTSLGK